MAKCLAAALLLLVVLAYCDGRELNQKDQALATARGAGGGVGEEKILGLPELPLVGTVTGTSTVTGPVVVLPALPALPAHP
uniref:Acclimation protein n=1 Tax=Secale cereale TaxID=4550 RepID=Q08164_SECCE|nr:acclimation protein [Secale cereale]